MSPASALGDLLARQAITDTLHRYCRAMDRMDRALALACWHPGGTDEHTPLFAGTGAAFVDWVWGIHEPMLFTRHLLTNILIEIEAEEAWSESYWTVQLRLRRDGALVDLWGGGRYIDHHRCIGGVWAFIHRRSVHEWDRTVAVEQASPAGPALLEPSAADAPIFLPSRSTHDPSYRALGGHDLRPASGAGIEPGTGLELAR